MISLHSIQTIKTKFKTWREIWNLFILVYTQQQLHPILAGNSYSQFFYNLARKFFLCNFWFWRDFWIYITLVGFVNLIHRFSGYHGFPKKVQLHFVKAFSWSYLSNRVHVQMRRNWGVSQVIYPCPFELLQQLTKISLSLNKFYLGR